MATFLLLHGAASRGWYWRAAMIPNAGERGHDWWANIDQPAAQRACLHSLGLDPADLDNPDVVYGHDIPAGVWAEAGRRLRDQSGRPFDDPCPTNAWPTIPSHPQPAKRCRRCPAPGDAVMDGRRANDEAGAT